MLVGVVTTMGERRCCAIGLPSSSMATSKHNSQYNHLCAAVQCCDIEQVHANSRQGIQCSVARQAGHKTARPAVADLVVIYTAGVSSPNDSSWEGMTLQTTRKTCITTHTSLFRVVLPCRPTAIPRAPVSVIWLFSSLFGM